MVTCVGCQKPVDELQEPASGVVLRCSKDCKGGQEIVNKKISSKLSTHYLVVTPEGMQYLSNKNIIMISPEGGLLQLIKETLGALKDGQLLICTETSGKFQVTARTV